MFSIGMFDFFQDLKGKGITLKTAALFYEDTLFGQDSSRVQRDLAAKHELQLVADLKYRANAPSLTTEIQQVAAARPDVFMPTSYINDAILTVKTMNEFGYRPPAIVAQDSGFGEPTFFKTVGHLGEGVISRGSFVLDLSERRPVVGRVNALFKERSKKDLSDVPARCFTGAMVMADAINRAGSTEAEAILAALRKTDIPAEQTIMPWKRIKFDETGQNQDATPIMIQYQGGMFRTIWPFESATVPVMWPMPA